MTSLRQLATMPHRLKGARVHKSAYISPRAVLREHRNITVGAHSTIGRGVELVPQQGAIHIGAHCSLNNHAIFYGAGSITISDNCRIATGVVFAAFNHGIGDLHKPIRQQPITAEGILVEEDVWIGALAVITDGVTIGAGSVVGAGSIVTRDVPPLSIVGGNPARLIRRRGEEPAPHPLNRP